MSSLTAIFGNSGEKTQDSDKLMDLYWNRAELKKEFADMRKEQYRLQDLIKKQEGSTARIQQKLDHLEDLLVDPDWAHTVVVFYQLRGLGRRCEQKLARFAEQLKQQREQKEHSNVLVDWNEERKQETKVVELQILEKRDLTQQLEDQLQSEQRRLTSMSTTIRFFRGRSVMRLIDELADQLEAAVEEQNLLERHLVDIKRRKPPDHRGLSVSTKRSINLMILAFAQELYIHFYESEIASKIRESMEKSVGAINYGSAFECEQLLSRIQSGTKSLEQATDFADVLQKRSRLLGNIAKFSNDTDAVPLSGTVSTVFDIDSNGLVRESDVNIAGENYWGISKVFSR